MLGSELKKRREGLGYTQAQLGEQLGVTENTIARWERGVVAIRPVMVRTMLKLLEAGPMTPERIATHTRLAQERMAKEAGRPVKRGATFWADLTETTIKGCPICRKRRRAVGAATCRTCQRFIDEYVSTGTIRRQSVPSVADVMFVMQHLGVNQDTAVVALGGTP